MAVFTKINNKDILNIENQFNLGKIIKFKGIKKGIENTNYLINIKNKKYILTIFEKRVNSRDLPFFMNLMSTLSKFKVKCPNPVKSKKGKIVQDLGVTFFTFSMLPQLDSSPSFDFLMNRPRRDPLKTLWIQPKSLRTR